MTLVRCSGIWGASPSRPVTSSRVVWEKSRSPSTVVNDGRWRAKVGWVSSASVPIALDEALRTGRCRPGDTVLLVAFGGGLTWSSALVTL